MLYMNRLKLMRASQVSILTILNLKNNHFYLFWSSIWKQIIMLRHLVNFIKLIKRRKKERWMIRDHRNAISITDICYWFNIKESRYNDCKILICNARTSSLYSYVLLYNTIVLPSKGWYRSLVLLLSLNKLM